MYFLKVIVTLLSYHFIDAFSKRNEHLPNCRQYKDGDTLPDIENCSQYYLCIAGKSLPQRCAPGLCYDAVSGVCNEDFLVDYSKHRSDHTEVPRSIKLPPAIPKDPALTRTQVPITTVYLKNRFSRQLNNVERSGSYIDYVNEEGNRERPITLLPPVMPKNLATELPTSTNCSSSKIKENTNFVIAETTTTTLCPTIKPQDFAVTQPPTNPLNGIIREMGSSVSSLLNINFVLLFGEKSAENPTVVFTVPPTPQVLTTTQCSIKPTNGGKTINSIPYIYSNKDCQSLPERQILLDHYHCRRYYVCINQRTKRNRCRTGYWFDKETLSCRPRSLVTNCSAGVN